MPVDEPRSPLETLFNPRSIAIAGASLNPNKQGHHYLKQLLDFGFKGKIYPVNPQGGEILGQKVYPSVSAIPEPVDYVICTISAEHVPQLIQDCTDKDVKVIQLYTAQLGETGVPERKQLEEHIVTLARRAGIRLLGPNCMGVYHPEKGLTFRFSSPKTKGEVAFISQSAGHAVAVMYRGWLRGLTFSKIVSYGNAADINETELLDYLAQDPETKVITAYIEGVRSTNFPKVLKAAARRKPVIIFKGGRTEAGVQAAASHTGALAGSYAIWQGLMKQCGVVTVESIEELIDTAIAFAKLPPPQGRNVGVLGDGGGGSVLAAEEFELHGLKTPPIPQEILEEIKTFLGNDWMFIKNPVDTSVVIPAGWDWEELKRIFRLIAEHPLYQILITDIGDWNPDAPNELYKYQSLVDVSLEVRKVTEKPMALVLRPADHIEEWKWRGTIEEQQRCVREGVAIFPSVTRAARALGNFVNYYLANSS